MLKRRSKISLVLRGGLLIFLLSGAISGCKKEAPPPVAVKPLPAKVAQPVPGAVSPAVATKPLQSAPSSAKKALLPATAQNAVQKQISTAKLPANPAAESLDFTSKRDPFKPFVQMPPKTLIRGKSKIRDPLPIQRFDTDKFRVSGIITGLKENSALVIDPSGKGHIVRAGMPFGSQNGRIKRITSTTIEVEENFMDDFGKVKKRLVKLMLLRKK